MFCKQTKKTPKKTKLSRVKISSSTWKPGYYKFVKGKKQEKIKQLSSKNEKPQAANQIPIKLSFNMQT